jgi:hypothetical protein
LIVSGRASLAQPAAISLPGLRPDVDHHDGVLVDADLHHHRAV